MLEFSAIFFLCSYTYTYSVILGSCKVIPHEDDTESSSLFGRAAENSKSIASYAGKTLDVFRFFTHTVSFFIRTTWIMNIIMDVH